jgi:hypothetical protein
LSSFDVDNTIGFFLFSCRFYCHQSNTMSKKSKIKQKMAPKAKGERQEEDLDRFAGSSDEDEDGEEQMAPPAVSAAHKDHLDADVENDTDDESEEEKQLADEQGGDADNQSISSGSSIEEEVVDPAFKMASAMGRILGGVRKTKDDDKQKAATTSVVLGKTVTPLQKLQQKEKEKLKALKEKRQAKKERNLSALHYPLSIATSNSVQTEGRLSVAKELEQERFHRRVATRGVVALFNAISQHQRSSSDVSDTCMVTSKGFGCCVSSFLTLLYVSFAYQQQNDASETSTKKKQEVSKMTKHGFLDKIKNTAKSKDASLGGDDKKRKNDREERDESSGEKKTSSSWSALKDDYLLNPKKVSFNVVTNYVVCPCITSVSLTAHFNLIVNAQNWDEESSDEEALQTEITEEVIEEIQQDAPRKKQRAGGYQ